MRRPLIALAAAVLALLPAASAAQITLAETDRLRFGLAGYVQTFTGLHDRGFDLPDVAGLPAAPRLSGFHGQVVRVKWQLEGAGWRFDLHDRLQARVTTGGSDQPVLGFGVSAVPDRLVDLDSDFVDEPGLRVWHDVDRLSVSLYTGAADLTIGRQAITWGTSTLFPVADLWARFSPFELDTDEKPGIDAVRALVYPADRLEVDAVLADRGALRDLSLGVRGTYGLAAADVWLGGGKFWRQATLMGGVTLLLDQSKIRAEALLPYHLDRDTFDDPRATLGFDWIRATFGLSAEYHFNGIGAASPDDYDAVLQDPRLARGETYYLGRHYLGGLISWSPDEENRVTMALNALANLQDGSVAFTPAVGYDLGQATRLSLGGLLSFGDTPRFTPLPTFGSEFGAYGDLLFTRLAVYF